MVSVDRCCFAPYEDRGLVLLERGGPWQPLEGAEKGRARIGWRTEEVERKDAATGRSEAPVAA